eukprot:13636036-Heterocapsa_arctica.AAC.1
MTEVAVECGVATTTEEVIIKNEIQPDREIIEQLINGDVETPAEPVKMKKQRAKAKPKEPTITKEDIMEA